MSQIESNLSAVERHYIHWTETGATQYKAMAEDELRHAEFFIRQAYESGQDVSNYRIWYGSLAAKLS